MVTPTDRICYSLCSKKGCRRDSSVRLNSTKGETVMGESGKKDKGKRETQKKALLDPKAKRKVKQEKKSKPGSSR